jgi:hypothetical protein
MAYSFGGGVRPELGKTDYSGYLQGALTGAQGVAAGGSAIGQGIANLGATIGGAIKEYNAKKEQKALDEAAGSAVINYARENRAAAEQLGFNLDQQDKGQVNAIVKSLGGAAPTLKAIQGLSDSQKQDKMVQEQQNIQKQSAAITDLMNRFGGDMSQIDMTGYDPRAVQASRNQMLQNQYLQAQINEKTASALRGGVESTAAQKDAEQIIQSELKTGKLSNDPMAIEARRADLIGRGGRNEQQPTEKYYNAGTFVRRIDQGGAIAAVRSSKDGRIGTVGKDGEFEPLDSNEFQPISPGDVNTFLGAEAFSKLSDELITNENSINAFNKYIKGAGSLPTGLDKATTRLTALLKTSITKEPLSDDEMNMGLSQARQQGLLGALRTSILGPGVLTEIDAQRILDRLGGDIESIFTNPAIVKEAMMEVLDMKMNEYDQRLSIYNGHVVGRYGQASGYKQRARISPYTPEEAEMASDPYGAIAEMERRKKLKKKQ